MNKEQQDWIIVGCFGRPHGVKGFVSVNSYTEPRENILNYKDWHVFLEHRWQPIKLLSTQLHSKTIIAQIEGFPGREAVARLTLAEIAIASSQLAPLADGEYYWHQLMGMNVVNQQGQLYGQVVEIMPTGSNDVLVVKGEKKHLIPYLLDQYVLSVNEQSRTIVVDWDMDF
ncbi:MAG: 16S rRNA processing protein RimM [Legionella sp.]|nr:MAG: 16S rRNA processing protein RimM [Legionella sp.]PJE00068.1 MAG: 16S rRNA processing protein RimM [Legionella sp.]